MVDLGFNYRITDFQSALGLSQLKKLDKFIKRRNKIAKIYYKGLENIDNLILPRVKPNILHAYHLFPVQINFKKIKISKEKLLKTFRKYNINLQIHYFPIHLQPYYTKKFKFEQNSFPKAENFYRSTVSLPIFYTLKNWQVKKIIRLLKKLIR